MARLLLWNWKKLNLFEKDVRKQDKFISFDIKRSIYEENNI
jgi:hypothetical protein